MEIEHPLSNLGLPPREIPLQARIELALDEPGTRKSYLLLAAGIILVYFTLFNVIFNHFAFLGRHTTVLGYVTGIKITGDYENSSGVYTSYRSEYLFQVPGGKTYTGVSFGEGKGLPYDVRDVVTVQYRKENPKVSRLVIKGRPQSMLPGLPSWMVTILLAASILSIGYGAFTLIYREGNSEMEELIKSGKPVWGEVIEAHLEDGENGKVDLQSTFSLITDEGEEIRMHFSMKNFRNDKCPYDLKPGEIIPFFYDPAHPEKAAPVFNLPYGLGVDDRGKLFILKNRPSWYLLFVPFLISFLMLNLIYVVLALNISPFFTAD